MRTVIKAATAFIFMLSLLGSAAQGQDEQSNAGQPAMHDMGMKNDMTEMMEMMKEMKQMMTECNKMMESMMNGDKSGHHSGESKTQSEQAD